MTSKPLLVYLDSSDISVLSNPIRTKELIDIEFALLDLQTKGLIEFRFSQIHIIEAAPKDADSIEFAKQRLNYIHKLCNKKCIASYVDVLEHEVLKISTEYDGQELDIYNNESKWFPKLERTASFNLKYLIEEHIESQPDRQQKRKEKQRLLTKNGEIKKGVLLKTNLSSPSSIKELMDKFPVTYDEANSCFKALINGTSDNQVDEILEKSYSEINRLPAWYEKQWDRVIPISSFMRNIGSNLKECTQRLSIESKDNYEGWRTLGLADKDINKKLFEIFLSVKITLPTGLVEKMAAHLGLEIRIDALSWHTAPSLLTATTLSYHIAKKSLFTGGTFRPMKISDFGDISHTFHLPHVDIFRADAFIASTIKDANLPFKTSVVGNLNSLLEVINNRLKSSEVIK